MKKTTSLTEHAVKYLFEILEYDAGFRSSTATVNVFKVSWQLLSENSS